MKISSSKPKIIVIGSSSIDLVLNVARYPAKNETIMATKVESYFGGKGSNQAVALARLGASVYFLGAVGMDPFGQQVLRNMKEEGVNVDFVHECLEAATGTAYVTTADHKNTIIVVAAANSFLYSAQVDEIEKYFQTADLILLQLEIPMETVEYTVKMARKYGVKVGVYAAPAKPLNAEIIEYATFIVAKNMELETIFGEGAKDEILHRYPNKLFVRDTGNSTTYFDGVKMRYLSLPTEQTACTMGMGDAFTSGFGLALCHDNEVEDCVIFGNLIAHKVSLERGSQKSLPKLRELLQERTI